MRKQLDVTTITNELRGNSAFFPRRRPEAADGQVDHISEPSPSAVPPTPHPVPPVPLVPEAPPTKRVMKQRHPFDIYQDQYEALQELALEERRQGGIGSMSAMVREALDKLIAERRNAEE